MISALELPLNIIELDGIDLVGRKSVKNKQTNKQTNKKQQQHLFPEIMTP